MIFSLPLVSYIWIRCASVCFYCYLSGFVFSEHFVFKSVNWCLTLIQKSSWLSIITSNICALCPLSSPFDISNTHLLHLYILSQRYLNSEFFFFSFLVTLWSFSSPVFNPIILSLLYRIIQRYGGVFKGSLIYARLFFITVLHLQPVLQLHLFACIIHLLIYAVYFLQHSP